MTTAFVPTAENGTAVRLDIARFDPFRWRGEIMLHIQKQASVLLNFHASIYRSVMITEIWKIYGHFMKTTGCISFTNKLI